MPDKGGGIPFINSNPAVPLPTGEVDSATIRPFPTSAHGGRQVYMHYASLSLSLSPMDNHFYMSLLTNYKIECLFCILESKSECF